MQFTRKVFICFLVDMNISFIREANLNVTDAFGETYQTILTTIINYKWDIENRTLNLSFMSEDRQRH